MYGRNYKYIKIQETIIYKNNKYISKKIKNIKHISKNQDHGPGPGTGTLGRAQGPGPWAGPKGWDLGPGPRTGTLGRAQDRAWAGPRTGPKPGPGPSRPGTKPPAMPADELSLIFITPP